jgi:UDP-3-O-[3-hydroxymyristoyl] N-acetylglucosamine deacetylase
VRVTLRAAPGPVAVRRGASEARLDELTVVSTLRATTVDRRGGGLRIATVEHAFAALGGLRVFAGLRLIVEGDEMPLLGGGAAEWCAAIHHLSVPGGRPRLRVARAATLEVGASRYELAPFDGVEMHARLELADARVEPDARWLGDAADFRRRIAPARTFCAVSDFEELARHSLARHVDPSAVIVLAPDAVYCTGPFEPDEPARHKLLDLVGDAYLYGGPPLGRLRATRPGHAANHAAFARAIAEGILAPLD